MSIALPPPQAARDSGVWCATATWASTAGMEDYPKGAPVRNKLANLVRMCPGQKIIVDFSGVPLVSSSFADEVLGKLFAELGLLTFMQRFDLRNIDSTVKQLVEKAISQRMSTA